MGFRETAEALVGWGAEAPAGEMAMHCPEGEGPFPAVLYCHAHGGEYAIGKEELTRGARWTAGPAAPDLLAAGFAVACVDMPGFGARQVEAPESALAKAALWRGGSLFGEMLATQRAALDRMAADPRVDATRLYTWGVSMGAALGSWLAALDQRVAGAVNITMLADIAPLIEEGAHDRHGPYLTVPGLLAHGDQGEVAALIAPRPFFVAHGGQDHLTPPGARDPALATLRGAWGDSPALDIHAEPEAGHGETPKMRAAALAFLARNAHKS